MNSSLSTQPDPTQARAAAVRIVARLRQSGFEAYFAGGCVRDELLGLHPTDFDIATSATPQQVRAVFPGTHEVGASFGVVLVPTGVPGPVHKPYVEVATFRTDGSYSDKRRPDSVQFASAEADAARRDFTINALFLDPLKPGPNPLVDGSIVDFVNGQQDLGARVLRAVGKPAERLAEDHLRALRAVRFAARLGLTVDRQTADAIRAHASELSGVSRERIGDEVRRMLMHPTRAVAASLMGWLSLSTPALGLAGRAFDHHEQPSPEQASAALPALAGLPGPLWPGVTVAAPLAAWLLDLDELGLRTRPGQTGGAGPKSLASRVRASLCLTNDECVALGETLACYQALSNDWHTFGVATQKRLVVRSGVVGAVLALRSIDSERAGAIEARIAELASQMPGLAPPPLITGDGLIASGGHPGPQFKRALDAAYDAQLEGRVTTPDEALRIATQVNG